MAKNPAGAPVPGSWGRQQKEGLEKQDKNALENQARRGAEGGAETDDPEMQKDQAPLQPTGGAGEPATTKLESEKQGGIGGS